MTITVKTRYASVTLTDDLASSTFGSASNVESALKLLKEAAEQVKELSKQD